MRILLALLAIVASAGTAPAQTGSAPGGPGPRAQAPAPNAPVVSEVLAVQVMLDRSGFSPGEIDGVAGQNLQRALRAFQRTNGLTDSGQLDAATWQRLTESNPAPPLITYDIVDADVTGPFTATIPDDLVAQAKLQALGYQSPLEKISERFHASPRLLRALNPGATFSAAGERITVPNVAPFELPARENVTAKPAPRGRNSRGGTSAPAGAASQPAGAVGTAGTQAVTIAVSRSANALTVEDGSGRILFHAPVTSGSERDPLPIGTWKVTGIHTMPVFNYNPDLFWDADPTHTKATLPPGPNNPVGIAWIDLSKEHYGIHGTPQPGRIGHAQSHGCVRLTNWDVKRLLQWVTPGTAVVFRN